MKAAKSERIKISQSLDWNCEECVISASESQVRPNQLNQSDLDPMSQTFHRQLR